jgi:hypothetical protein
MWRSIIWFIVRITITLLCCKTLQYIISLQGYRIDFSDVLISAVMIIVGVRIWLPFDLYKKTNIDGMTE